MIKKNINKIRGNTNMRTLKQILNRIKKELNNRISDGRNIAPRIAREVQNILNERNDNS